MSSYKILAYPASKLPEAYKGLIFAKWLHSYRNGNNLFKVADYQRYFKIYHHHIEGLLLRPNAVLRLAVLSDDHDVVLGFSVSRANVLDYIYVDKRQRKNGIGASLFPKGIDTFSHMTTTARQILIWDPKEKVFEFHNLKLKFDPFI